MFDGMRSSRSSLAMRGRSRLERFRCLGERSDVQTLVPQVRTDDQCDPHRPHTADSSPASLHSAPLARSVVSRTLSTWSLCPSSALQPEEKIANAPKLEPSLEGLLLSSNVKSQIIDAFRVQEVTSINLMVALDSTEEGFMKTLQAGIRNGHRSRRLCPQEGMGHVSEDHV